MILTCRFHLLEAFLESGEFIEPRSETPFRRCLDLLAQFDRLSLAFQLRAALPEVDEQRSFGRADGQWFGWRDCGRRRSDRRNR